MNISDIQRLAQLARLEISDQEAEGLLHDLESTLSYVNQVTEVSIDASHDASYLTIENICREDVVTNETGAFTEVLLKEAPATENGFVKVKKIL